MKHLGRAEQLMLCIFVSLLLLGWAVKAYRTAHPTIPLAAEVNR